jgi:hypothetical protein
MIGVCWHIFFGGWISLREFWSNLLSATSVCNRQQVSPELRFLFTKVHGVKYLNTAILFVVFLAFGTDTR